MPELPEVEVVRLGLAAHVVGRRIDSVVVHEQRSVRRHLPGASDFTARMTGRTVTAAHRRGKYLWLPLDDEDAMVAHLGMSGQILIRPVGCKPERHLRVTLGLSGRAEVHFVDQRMFGGLSFSEGGAHGPAEIGHIARDPVDPAFDDDAFISRLRRRRTGIKRALLDQTLVSGIGNIYADEALWTARLHFARPTETLRRREIQSLLAAVRTVMLAALDQGGTSFDALYVNTNGQSGYFDRSLEAYGREGLPCSRCGSPIRRDSFMNRSSFTCPRCQPRPRRARW